jgi:capsular polysaccharide transport system permease protein
MQTPATTLPLKGAVAGAAARSTRAGPLEAPRRQQRRGPGITALSALAGIGGPLLVALIYYGLLASHQYVTEFKFSVRGPSAMQDSGGGSALIGGLVADAFAVTEFINSPQMIAEVAAEVDVRRIYNAHGADFWARLGGSATREDLADYWRSVAAANFDMLTGIVTVSVRAFSPEDAMTVAQAVVRRADAMAFKMTERARADSVRFAEEEVRRAESQLQTARTRLRTFREKEKVIDAGRSATASSDTLGRLREELSRMRAELSTMTPHLAQTAPQVQLLRSRIKATEDQIVALSTNVGDVEASRDTAVNASVMAQFESLNTELQFAEKGYAAALEALQRARANADRRTTYITLFVEPSKPETSLYPRRVHSILLVGLVASALWCLGLLVVSSIRDHLL